MPNWKQNSALLAAGVGATTALHSSANDHHGCWRPSFGRYRCCLGCADRRGLRQQSCRGNSHSGEDREGRGCGAGGTNNISSVNGALSQNAFGYYVVDANDGANMALCNNGATVAMFPLNMDSGTILRTIANNTTNGRPTWGQNFKDASAWGAGMAAGQVGVSVVAGVGLGLLEGLFGGSDSSNNS